MAWARSVLALAPALRQFNVSDESFKKIVQARQLPHELRHCTLVEPLSHSGLKELDAAHDDLPVWADRAEGGPARRPRKPQNPSASIASAAALASWASSLRR